MTYTRYDVDGRSGRGWKRIVLWTAVGLVVAVLVAGAGFYLWFRAQVSEANERVSEEIKVVLAEKPGSTLTSLAPDPESPGAPAGMNLLVLGSDRRPDEEDVNGRSDTIILVHADPDSDYLSVLSLPRDLRVEVPGHGLQKINAAYALGGPALAIRTVEQVTGVDINHYMEVGFDAFKDMTNALGGVYMDVDRRYYNDDPDYELIDLLPGYQLLGGDDALDYVRFRRDRNMDFGRMERQQRFLSELRGQAVGWDLAFKLPRLVKALFSNVATDMGANDFIKLAWWLIHLDGGRIRQLTVVGDIATIAGASYVLLDEEALAEAVGAFLTPPSTKAGMTTTTANPDSSSTGAEGAGEIDGLEVDVLSANRRPGEAAVAGEWLEDLGFRVITVGDADETAERTAVQYPTGLVVEAREVAELVEAESVRRDRALERVTILLGEDFSLPWQYARPLEPEEVPSAGAWKAIAETVPFAIRAPSYLPRHYWFAQKRPEEGGTYGIEVDDGAEPALTMLYRLIRDGNSTDQFMSITETTWLDAPAAAKGKEVAYGDTVFTVVGSSGKAARVWWRADGVLYWVSNTLSHLLSEEELLAIAQSMVLIPAG